MVPFGQFPAFMPNFLYSRGISAGPDLPIAAGHNQNRAWNQALGPIVLCQTARNAWAGTRRQSARFYDLRGRITDEFGR